MTTVGAVVDRLFTDFLEPPDETWLRTSLLAPVSDSTTAWPVDLDAIATEERSLLAPGVTVEADGEQATVVELSGTTLTVRRGVRGTEAAAHDQGDMVLVAPPFTRQTVRGAVADAIVGVHPPLHVSRTAKREVDSDGLVDLPEDAAEVVRLFDESDCDVQWRDLGELEEQGRALRVFGVAAGKDVWVSYHARFPYTSSEDTVLAQLGVRDEWVRIVMVGAAAQLVASKPMSSSWQDFLTAQLRSESYPVETPGRIRDSLLRYYQYLIDRAAAGLMFEEEQRVVYT